MKVKDLKHQDLIKLKKLMLADFRFYAAIKMTWPKEDPRKVATLLRIKYDRINYGSVRERILTDATL